MTSQPGKKLITLGVVSWISFLGAGVATVLFFATFDPEQLMQVATFPLPLDRMAGYSIGFLCFWILLIANSLIAVWLLDTRSANKPPLS